MNPRRSFALTAPDAISELPGVSTLDVTLGDTDATRPTFTWSPPAAEASYQSVVQSADGAPLWAGTGVETSVVLGGAERAAVSRIAHTPGATVLRYSQNVLEINPTVLARMMTAGHRFTKSRELIIATLATLGQPATIPTILAAEPRLSQSSLYRNLMILEDAGLVSRLTVGSDYALFELSEELTDHHHHHLVCRSCHVVADIDLPVATERLLDQTLAEATAASGFTLEDHRLDLVGLCGTCQESATT